uniref:Uncharacterized protein n=1 Tax=Anopheles albimanus TaxID=7167 RepID=A0A182FX16_ANOAL
MLCLHSGSSVSHIRHLSRTNAVFVVVGRVADVAKSKF